MFALNVLKFLSALVFAVMGETLAIGGQAIMHPVGLGFYKPIQEAPLLRNGNE